jgi:DNA (cytosine-5)-methyltransferase 1
MEDEAMDQAPVWDDVKTMRCPEFADYVRQFRPLLLSGGYPCQPFSLAGKRAGEADERHLWPSIDQFIGEVMPEFVFFENVAGHVSLGLGAVVRDLQRRGYSVAAGLFSAYEVGAAHERLRVFVLAVADTERGESGSGSRLDVQRRRAGDHKQAWVGCRPMANPSGGFVPEPGRGANQRDGIDSAGADVGHAERSRRTQAGERRRQHAGPEFEAGGGTVADAGEQGLQGAEWIGSLGQREREEAFGSAAEFCLPLFAPGPGDAEAWREIINADPTLEPAICRDSDGLATGMDCCADRLRLTGNGVVPLTAAKAFVCLAAKLMEEIQ